MTSIAFRTRSKNPLPVADYNFSDTRNQKQRKKHALLRIQKKHRPLLPIPSSPPQHICIKCGNKDKITDEPVEPPKEHERCSFCNRHVHTDRQCAIREERPFYCSFKCLRYSTSTKDELLDENALFLLEHEEKFEYNYNNENEVY